MEFASSFMMTPQTNQQQSSNSKRARMRGEEERRGPESARGSDEPPCRRRLSQLEMLKSISLLLAFTILSAKPIDSLKISSIEVPAAVINGSQVNLVCNYDLQGDQLYSVKWYKNYVEFYRYQPAASQADEASASTSGGSGPGGNAKQEFELNGINLNLAKCNGTHVQLRQSNLASEGTYKCEVSAESPSFATVSSERQMKIYENSPASSSQQQQEASQPGARQLVYNINDIVNLTCQSGPSRPAAKLTWLLNDRPVSSASKWLSQQLALSSLSSDGIPLVESRLTLSFRLQPEHLLATTSGGRVLPELFQLKPVQQTLKLRCLAKLSLEYATQTSVLVSGGKTSMSKNNKQQTNSQLPRPAPLVDNQIGNSQVNSVTVATTEPEVSPYRWPRPAGQRQSSPSASSRRNSPAEDPWPSPVTSGREQAEMSESRNLRLRSWNQRQLRQQADHIEQLLRLLRPNELESPSIEAKLVEPEVFLPEGFGGASPEPLPMPSAEGESELKGEWEQEQPRASDSFRQPKSSKSSTGDYQLNDLVRFTCRARFGTGSDQRVVGADLAEARNSLSSSWLVNGDQLPLNQINAFDGNTNKFYFVREQYGQTRRSAPLQSPNRSLVGSISSERMEPASEENKQTSGNETGSESSHLLIEFTQSLFQAKELQLTCRTIVEQPLIEYESQLIALVPTSHFIQANNSNRKPARGQSQSSRLNGKPQRNRNSRPQANSSSSSSSSFLKSGHFIFAALFLVQINLIVLF